MLLEQKFCKNVSCICGSYLSPMHVILKCDLLKPYLSRVVTQRVSAMTYEQILADNVLMLELVKNLVRSPVGTLL